MNTLLANQLSDLIAAPPARTDALCENALRVAAGTLLRASDDEVSGTTVVGLVGADDRSSFEALVDRIADESGVDAQIRWRGESFSVRLSRQPAAPRDRPRRVGVRQMLLGLLSGLRHGA